MEHILAIFSQWWEVVLPWYIVLHYEGAVQLSRGKLLREVGPGLHWKWPLIDSVLTCNVKPAPATMRAQSLVTDDGVQVVVQVRLVWSVHDVTKFLLEVEDQETVLADSVYGVVTEHVTSSKWDALSAAGFRESVEKQARRRAYRFGVKIENLYFSDISRMESLRLVTNTVLSERAVER